MRPPAVAPQLKRDPLDGAIMNRLSRSVKQGRALAALAGVAMILPEVLGPILTPKLGGMVWPRFGGTVLLALGVSLGIRWVRWVTVGLTIVALLLVVSGSAILPLPADRISYLLLLASLDAFVLYVLLVSDSASDFFEVRSKRIGAKNQPPTSRGAV